MSWNDGMTQSLSDRDPFAAHHEHMRQVMRSFSEPFGRDPLLRLPEGGAAAAGRAPEGRAQGGRALPDSQLALRGSARVSVRGCSGLSCYYNHVLYCIIAFL